jgi:hypothetical protein
MRDEAVRVAHALGARNATAVLAQIVAALLTEEENEERRDLLLLHGSKAAPIQRVSTTPIRHLPSILPRVSDDDPETSPSPIEHTLPGVVIRRMETPVGATPVPTPPRTKPVLWLVAAGLAVVYLLVDLVGGGPVRDLLRSGGANLLNGGDSLGVVATIPSGAAISLNGESLGPSPQWINEWPRGPATLRIEYPGFEPLDTVLAALAEGTRALPYLPPFVLRSRVHVRSIPEGARVRVDGVELSDWGAADWAVAATDTVELQLTLAEGQVTPSAYFSPLAGLIAPTDTTRWRWQPPIEESPGQLTGTFTRLIRIRSYPPSALIYLDGDSASAGVTDLSLELTYGDHALVLRREAFLDYGFQLHVGPETPDLFAPVLKRTVQIRAFDTSTPSVDLGASVEWIRQGTTYIKTPRDHVQTPYSIALGGVEHEVRFQHAGYRDTTVVLGSEAGELLVAMCPASLTGGSAQVGNGAPNETGDSLDLAWVQFTVRDNRGPVAGAEVIGIEKSTGIVVRYGLTDESGEIFTRVPIGDYNWEASKIGYESRTNGERISRRRDFKKITLRLTNR